MLRYICKLKKYVTREAFIMKSKRKVISLVISICLILVSCLCSGRTSTIVTQAAKTKKTVIKKTQQQVKLNKKKVTLKLNSKNKITLKLKNATKKVTWKTSDKKIAAVKKVNGKKKSQAVIWAKGEGTCNIIAKMGKKKYICKVTVKNNEADNKQEDTPDDIVVPVASKGAVGVYVTSASAIGKSITMKTRFYNYTDKEASFGLDFSIEKWSDGKWIAVERTESICVPAIAIIVRSQAEGSEQSFSMNNAKENFTTGKYRINTSLSAADSTATVYRSAEFWLSVE